MTGHAVTLILIGGPAHGRRITLDAGAILQMPVKPDRLLPSRFYDEEDLPPQIHAAIASNYRRTPYRLSSGEQVYSWDHGELARRVKQMTSHIEALDTELNGHA